ncbi:MAG: DUF2793 domain-containing protein [Maricaulaceae bacterium]|nr:DUF2793 domain-containing protein [Maricaulaceae bacterium]
MTEISPRLGLGYLMPAQAQKHVTVNETLRRLDALVMLTVESRGESAQPAEPEQGQAWILPESPSGADWETMAEGDIAAFQDGAWAAIAPRPGWRAWVRDEGLMLVHDGEGWAPLADSIAGLQNLTRLGVGTEADAGNPFAAKLNKALWTARYEGEGGDGDLRYTLNKQGESHVLSLLLQSGWEGRAEIGLTGDDDLSVKVSADGAAWLEALKIGRADGMLSARGWRHAPTGAEAAMLLFTPGGDGQVSIYRQQTTAGQNPRTAAIDAVSDNVITLTAADAGLFGEWSGFMAGVAMARIWNIDKDPAQSAWLTGSPSSSQLQVLDAGAIAGWANGETVQFGDPGSGVGRVIALDISPMLTAMFGAPFRQKGIMVRANLHDATDNDGLQIAMSPAAGAFITAARAPSSAGVTIISCVESSPVSDSNLVFVREVFYSTAGVRLLSSIAVFA